MSTHTCNAWVGSLGCRACQESEDRARAAKEKSSGVYRCARCARCATVWPTGAGHCQRVTVAGQVCGGLLSDSTSPLSAPIDARSYRKGVADTITTGLTILAHILGLPELPPKSAPSTAKERRTAKRQRTRDSDAATSDARAKRKRGRT